MAWNIGRIFDIFVTSRWPFYMTLTFQLLTNQWPETSRRMRLGVLSPSRLTCMSVWVNIRFFCTFQKQFAKKIYRDRQFKKLLEHFLPNRINLNNFFRILHSVKPLNREFQIQNIPFPPKKNGYCLRTLRNQLTLHCVLKFDTPTTFWQCNKQFVFKWFAIKCLIVSMTLKSFRCHNLQFTTDLSGVINNSWRNQGSNFR